MHNRKLRVGIIGLGRTASLLEDDPLRAKPASHAGTYAKHSDLVEMVAGTDTEPEARERFKARWDVPHVYEDYREMLEKEALDIVSICAYATERTEMVINTANAGVKGIWCEKAIATNLRDAVRMIQVCDEKRVATAVAHARRWDPRYIDAANRITRGDLGVPDSIVAHFHGSLLHSGTHAFDVMRMFLGDVVEVSGGRLDLRRRSAKGTSGYAEGKDIEIGDVGGYATLLFENGAIGTVHAFSKAYHLFYFDVFASHGAFQIGNDIPTKAFTRGAATAYTGFVVLYPEDVVVLPCDCDPVTDLLGTIQDGLPGRSTLRDGMKALEIGLAIHASHYRDHCSVRLPLEDYDITVASR